MVVGLGLAPASIGCKARLDARPPMHQGEGGDATAKAESVEAILAASDLPPTLEEPIPSDPMAVTVHRLSNGMTVYISTDRQKPRFVGWIGVRAGSRHDPPDSTGLAHYLEHMLFKGTDDYGTLDADAEAPHVERVRELYAELREADPDRRKSILKEIDRETQEIAKYAVPNELDRMYAAMGVEGTNAFTSFEQTVYIGDIPSNRLDAWAIVEAERFADPVFRLFLPELEAVYEEKNLSLDNPYRRVNEALYRTLFPRHPYGTQTTIGSVEHLKTPAYQDMVDYFDRWYAPNNMAIVLAGDVDPETALPVLEKTFSRLRPRRLGPPTPGELSPPKGRQVTEVVAEGEEGISIAWHTVPQAHEDVPVLAVMDRVLDDAKVGLLNVELELTQRVPEAGSYHGSLVEAGYFLVRARARHDQTPEELEALLMGVVQKLKKGEFTEADVEAVKLQESVRQKLELEFPFARASKMMDAFIARMPWEAVLEGDRRFQQVTREDVIRVANRYLGDDRVVVIKRKGKPEIPKLEKPEITPVEIDASRKSAFAQEIERMPVAQLEPEWAEKGKHYVHRPLPAGDLVAAVNERNDLFSLEYRFRRGYRKAPLLCYALDLFELSGSGDASAEALQKQLYALGSSVSTSCDAEYSSIEISGLDAKLEETLALVDRWLADPRFDSDLLDRHYESTLTRRRDHLEEDRILTGALDLYAKYGKESAWLKHPSNAQLRKADAKAIRNLITTVMDWEHDTLYFGPRRAEEVASVVARGKKHKKTGEVWVRRYRPVKRSTVFFLHKDGAKANVRLVIPQGKLPREERPVARLVSEYLSGNMSALVFQELRESRGLAYTASARYDSGRRTSDETGLLGFLSTQADKTPVAIETFLGLLRNGEVQPDRLAGAKVSLDQEYRATRIDPRWITHWVLSWNELGEKEDPRPWEWASVLATEVDVVETFVKRFVDAPVIIAIVGDRSRVGLEQLERIAEIREVTPEDLFSYGPFPRP